MDIDETKKRKIEQETNIELETILKQFLDSNQNVAKLLAVLTHKIVNMEKVFNKDLFQAKTPE